MWWHQDQGPMVARWLRLLDPIALTTVWYLVGTVRGEEGGPERLQVLLR